MDSKLSFADAALINAAMVVVISQDRIVFNPDAQALAIDCLEEVMNKANWEHPHVGDLIMSARHLSKACLDKRARLDRTCTIELEDLRKALMRAMTWRLGESLEAWRTRRHAA